jgi:hypothetical protein
VHCEDARGTMALDRASVVGVGEGADEEGREEDEEDQRRSSTDSSMRPGTHHRGA